MFIVVNIIIDLDNDEKSKIAYHVDSIRSIEPWGNGSILNVNGKNIIVSESLDEIVNQTKKRKLKF